MNGTFDVELDNGELERGVDREKIRMLLGVRREEEGKSSAASRSHSPSRREQHELASRRAAYYDQQQEGKEDYPAEAVFRPGDRVACYWYRGATVGAAKFHGRPKAGLVKQFNGDGTYTIALELGGQVIDDVKPEHLRDWADGTVDLRLGSSATRSVSPSKPRITDKWVAVFEMGRDMLKQGKSRHVVPGVDDIDGFDLDSEEKARRILGSDLFDDFHDAFERQDFHREGEIDTAGVLKGFSKMGGKATEDELRLWSRGINKDGRTQKSFDFIDFVLAYANLFHPPRAGKGNPLTHSRDDDIAVGKTLRLSGEWQTLGGFARVFGKRQMRDLERAFDAYAEKDPHGDTFMRACDIIEAFHRLGRAITVTRLQEWMTDADILPQDKLSLADFTSVFAFFFSPGKEAESRLRDSKQLRNSIAWSDEDDHATAPKGRLTLSEIAVQILQEERWRGSADQTNAFIRRICAGRFEDVANSPTLTLAPI